VPYFLKNDVVSRSPICLIHDNGQFFNWITSDEHPGNTQNFLIVNYPRAQLTKLFRFIEERDEKLLRSFMTMIQLTPNSVAVRHMTYTHTTYDCVPEVTTFYYDYLTAAERTLREQKSARIVDVMRQMATPTDSPPCNPCITQMFSQSAKRLLSRRACSDRSSLSDNSDSESPALRIDEDGTATKMAKVNSGSSSPT